MFTSVSFIFPNWRCIDLSLRIQKDMFEISLREYDASWKKYASFKRAWTISLLYKRICGLQKKIEVRDQ